MVAGTIFMYAGSTAPTGYLLCDGSNVSRTTYAKLFDAIGVMYGAGNGSTTFALPDLKGRIVIGVSSTHNQGNKGGEETHTLTSAEMPSHTHTVPEHGHGHTVVFKTPSLSHSITTQPAFNYNKPNGTSAVKDANPASKTAYSGATATNATRSTSVTVADHAATACTMGGAITDKTAFNTENNGSGTAHSNMQPFVTLTYIIATGD